MFNAYIQGVKYIGKNVIGGPNLQIKAFAGCPCDHMHAKDRYQCSIKEGFRAWTGNVINKKRPGYSPSLPIFSDS